MDNKPFIGVGHNPDEPDGPDLPLGLGMQIGMDTQAMKTFGNMSNEEKSALIHHIQGAATGDEAKSRIDRAVSRLHEGQTRF
ncbi:MAG: hypothetical protein LIO58_07135 [Oscillospiraceae bacterium]|nr:hypothetical protein [Oscillospiraceae bacterium]